MGIRSLIQVVGAIATIVILFGQLDNVVKRVQIAKIHLLNGSKGSSWGRVMVP